MRGSLAARGWRATLSRVRQELHPDPAPDATLDLLPLDAPRAPFAVPAGAAPRVSVVIPVYGKIAYTLACLRSIARHGAQVPVEIIVVDDASPDDSVEALSAVAGVRVLRNAENLGFVGSCNAGAAAARGEYLLFLNNDTQVTPGWLDALIACFAEEADCGIAGSRLVYPDGRLQEAGGIVWSDGGCWNCGRFESRALPAYRFRRRVDYVSGASLMIRRAVFAQVGGFDRRYAPGYCEDTDLAFAVRKLGLAVYCEPGSTVIHCEGVSAGTDPGAGMKRHQAPNQKKLAAKWEEALRAQPPPGTPVDRAMRWRARGRILVVDAQMPEPARDSGSLRLCALLRILVHQGWSVSFAPDDGHASALQIAALGALGCEVLARPWQAGLPSFLRRHGKDLHAVILARHTVASQYARLVRRHAPQARLLFDTVDLHFLRERRAARCTGNTALARQAESSRRSELALVREADRTFVVSPHEAALLARLVPGARVDVLSNIHAVRAEVPPHAGRRDLVFIGGCGHPPNLDAVRWIADAILPALRAALPDLCVHVLGDAPDAVRDALACPGLLFHGRVLDLAPWLDACLASIAPLRFGAGVKGKINMAMSHGVPVIATPIAIEGMRLAAGEDVLVAARPEDFVSAALRLRDDAALWERLSAAGRGNVRAHFSAAAAAVTLERALT